MVEKIGVRELKNQTSQIVRRVREEQTEYVVTVHGKPVAVLRPFTETDQSDLRLAEILEALARIDALAKKISENWDSDKTPLEVLEEQRQDGWE